MDVLIYTCNEYCIVKETWSFYKNIKPEISNMHVLALVPYTENPIKYNVLASKQSNTCTRTCIRAIFKMWFGFLFVGF